MAMIVLSSPATLTGSEEKKTGPSRFIADFLTELTKLSKFRIYQRADSRFTQIIHLVYTDHTLGIQAGHKPGKWKRASWHCPWSGRAAVDGGCVADQRSRYFQRISCLQYAAAGLCHSRGPLTLAAFVYRGQ